ncbi:MAG: carbohydrate kinase family protein [Phycisphaeraceae bacterium]|nr:carbohydrate kinase family protein [Phycisphaeraceae bacterium]
MDDSRQIAEHAATALQAAAGSRPKVRAVVGFDGFVDSMIRVVDRRRGPAPDEFDPVATIGAFAQRIGRAAGRSGNIELVVQEDRPGGNAPNHAQGLAALGARVTLIGAVGSGQGSTLHPTFSPLSSKLETILPIATPGQTLALEFDDGKVMFNIAQQVQAVTWDAILRTVGADRLTAMLADADLLSLNNWTICAGAQEIWDRLSDDVLPSLGRRLHVQIDLSDPAKRDDADIREMLGTLRRMNASASVCLGLNLAESARIALVAGADDGLERLGERAGSIRAAIGVDAVAIHDHRGAAIAGTNDRAEIMGPFTRSPLISTGAGDRFNAGLALARALGLDLHDALACGVGVGGWFVRHGHAPTLAELAGFLRAWPHPEPESG